MQTFQSFNCESLRDKPLSGAPYTPLVHNEIMDDELIGEITYPTEQNYQNRDSGFTPKAYGCLTRNVNSRIDGRNQPYEIDNQE